MGVEHYLICEQCKEYIDIHKSYSFARLIDDEQPPVFGDGEEFHFCIEGGYWEMRGLWFLYHHRGHQGVRIMMDCYDDWFRIEPTLKEVYPHPIMHQELLKRKEPE